VGGGFVLRHSPLELGEFAALVLEETRQANPGREIEFERAGDLQGEWDLDRLAQLLNNLLTNALIHGQQDAPVRLRVQGEPDSVVLAVHNRGAPIPPGVIPHLFEPMRRGEGTGRANKTKSIGLGLFIVQQIVLAHGGTVGVDSTLEQGTTFTVRLPRHPPAPKTKP
jgi:signal transduction histidine kinase